MRIKDLSPRGVVTVVQGETLSSAAKALAEEEVGDLLVYAATGPTGVFSERDLVRAVADGADLDGTDVDEYMTTSVVTVDWDSPIGEAISKMNDHGIRHLVVMREGLVQGMVSMRDFVAVLGTAWPEL
jgi:CBS domain-containing protein